MNCERSRAFNNSIPIVLFILLSVLLLLSSYGCKRNSQESTPSESGVTTRPTPAFPPPPRATIRPSEAIPEGAISYLGEVKPAKRVDLTAKVPGRIREIKVEVGDRVKKGDLLAVLEHNILDIQVKQAETALALAKASLARIEEGYRKELIAKDEAALKGVQAELDLLLAGAKKEEIDAAKARLDGAQAELDALLAGATPEKIQIAVSKVRDAEEKKRSIDVETARTLQLTRITDNETLIYAQSSRDTQLAMYEAKVQIARDELNDLKAPPNPYQIAKLKAAVDAARAHLESLKAPARSQQVAQLESKVASARQQLEITKNPYTVHDLEISRLGVQKEQATLELAKAQREEAFLYAPFDGTVQARMASEGTLASANMPLLTIISREIEAQFNVEEAAIPRIKLGQSWDIKTVSFPDKTFKGRVKATSPALNPATRTLEVLISPEDPENLLFPGMFITASLSRE